MNEYEKKKVKDAKDSISSENLIDSFNGFGSMEEAVETMKAEAELMAMRLIDAGITEGIITEKDANWMIITFGNLGVSSILGVYYESKKVKEKAVLVTMMGSKVLDNKDWIESKFGIEIKTIDELEGEGIDFTKDVGVVRNGNK